MNKNYQLREATLSDLKEIVRLRVEFLTELGNIHNDEERTKIEAATEMYLLQMMPRKEIKPYFIELDGKTVCTGAVIYFRRPPVSMTYLGTEGYVMNIYTLPEHRRKGLATKMMKHIISELKKENISRAWLHATETGSEVYKALGFEFINNVMELRFNK